MRNFYLPEAMAEVRGKLGTIVAGMEQKAPYAAVLLSRREGTVITVDNREERVMERPPAAGAVLTAYDGVTVHERALGDFAEPLLEKASRELVKSLTLVPGGAVDPGAERRGDFVTSMEIPPESLSMQEKLERCRALQRRVRALDSRIVNVNITYGEVGQFEVFCNRSADLAQRIQRIRLFVEIFVSDGAELRYDFTVAGGTGGWELLILSEDRLRLTANNAIALLTAERINPGEYQIVASPSVTGTIVHESFGHGVETDMFLKQRARAANYIGKAVGSRLVNIWDDPTFPRAFGSYFFDDEGVLAGPTAIVQDGVFRRGITDMVSASALGIRRSANGRRQDYTRKAYARMSNTALGPGSSTLPEILAQVEDGVYLDKWSSGMEDPKGWGIQVTCHYGHEITNGRITDRMFAPVAITGYVPDVLGSITAVSGELEMDLGACGKGHKEMVFVSAGGPHVLLKARLG